MLYADFEYYSSCFFGDSIPGKDFEKYAVRASREIDRLTMGRACSAAGEMSTRLSTCCCEIAEILYKADVANKRTENGTIASESNDGYSVSFENGDGTDGQSLARRIITTAVCWLSAPQNLVYPGV